MNDTRNYFMKYNHVWFLYFSSPVKSIMQYFCFARGEFVHIFKNSGFFSFFCDKMHWHKQPKGEMVYFSSQFREQTLMSGRWRQQVASHLWSWNIFCSSFLKFILFLSMCMCVCWCVNTCLYPWRPEEGTRSAYRSWKLELLMFLRHEIGLLTTKF